MTVEGKITMKMGIGQWQQTFLDKVCPSGWLDAYNLPGERHTDRNGVAKGNQFVLPGIARCN